METQDRKYLLQIIEGSKVKLQTPITEYQQRYIEIYLRTSTPAHLVDEKIIDYVSQYFRVTASSLHSRTRTPHIALARQLCFYFFVKHLGYSTGRAGRVFNRDHATVIHSMKVVEAKHVKHIVELETLLGFREASGLSVPEMATTSNP